MGRTPKLQKSRTFSPAKKANSLLLRAFEGGSALLREGAGTSTWPSRSTGGSGEPLKRRFFYGWSLNTRCAFSRRNFGQTWSLKGTFCMSVKIRSSDRPIGKYPAYMILSVPRVFA